MQGILLDRRVSIWRKVYTPSTGQYNDTQVYPAVRCAVVPISRFDAASAYAYESTHLIWVEYWLNLRKEDQIRDGRRPPDPEGDVLQWIFTVNGRREFRMGIPQKAYYAREAD